MNEFTFLTDPDFKKIRYYIGASDVSTLVGLNLKYNQSPLTLWEQKTGRAESFSGNERTKKGNRLETIVLEWGLEKMKNEEGENLYDENFLTAFHISRLKGELNFSGLFSKTECACPGYPFIKSHADLIHDDYILEGKSTGFFGGKRDDNINVGYDKEDLTSNGIPSTVYIQVQTQMLCYGIDMCYVSVMIDTGIHRLYGPIPANKKTQEKILAICERFWWHVENDQPPEPKTWKDVLGLNPGFHKDSKIMIGGEQEYKAIEMKERAEKLRERKKRIEEELADIKNAMGLIIGENRILESSSGEKLASAFKVEKYFLKDYKKMSKRRLKGLIKDGFISITKYRDMRF